MPQSINKLFVGGHLGQDPEVTQSGKGTNICKFSIATNNKVGENEKTTWHNVVCFGKTAEIASDRLQKGAYVLVEGRQENESYTFQDKETGEERKGFSSSVIANRIMLTTGGKQRGDEPSNFAPKGGTSADDFDLPDF